ncbi:MAG: 50S ribosomal protein L11 methyltransferase [Proteobacteria bacterium]|nr:50S ribosomal protein L11 methyltransferase [Pseudomonadota bacterium]
MLQVIIETTSSHAELLSDLLTEQGALAVSLSDAGDQPLFQEQPQQTPLWNNTKITALFENDYPVKEIIQHLEKLLETCLTYQVEAIAETDWVEKTQQTFSAHCFANKLWIVPSGITVRINPGLGFGTGEHPTTALCLEWLANQELTAKSVIDYGCGSGILGLSALALGAKKVWAVDHDPQALTATQNNAELNSFTPEALTIMLPEHLPEIKADIILANILANPLRELAPKLIALLAPGGSLVLSGFFLTETDAVVQAYKENLDLEDIVYKDNWARAILK